MNQSWSPGHLLLGILLGIVGPLWTAPLRPTRVRLHRLPAAMRLTATVAGDVFASNLQVARVVWRSRPPASRFVRIPLEIRDAYGLAALAIIATVVPGTVWTELAMDRGALLMHLLDVDDEQDYVAFFKQRYERPLMEIFE